MGKVHAYAFPVISLVFLVSFLELLNVPMAEARKLANSNGVFSFDLIRRHSPLSPYYNSSITRRELLKRAPLGAISPSHKIHLSTKHNIKDNVIQSLDVDPDYYFGEHYIKFTLGTPGIEQYGIADTGSSLIWVQCLPCKTCIPQELTLFDPTKSSTFHTVPCTSNVCNNNLNFRSISCPTSEQNTTERSNSLQSSCNYEISYVDGANSSGVLATDTFGSDTSTIFGCGYDQNGDHEGIVGLGTGSTSLISQLGPKINYKFSYCLTPLSSDVSSRLNFGVDVTGPAVVSTPFTTGNGDIDDYHYHLTLDGISVGVKDNPIKIHMPVALDMIIDSGTTLTFLPPSVYDSVKEAVANAIEHSPIKCPVSSYQLCYETNLTDASVKLNPPDLVFHFRGADVVLKTYNLFREIDDNVIALAMIASESLYLFGNVAQVNYHVGYDLQAKQVSFAPTNCAKQ